MRSKKQTIKHEKYRSEEQEEIIKFVKILLGVIVLVLAFYFATRIFVKKDISNSEEETAVTEVNYNKIIFGTMLNRPNNEYYVIAFDSKDNNASYYNYIVSNYRQQDSSLNIYYIDLNDSLNKEFIAKDENININTSDLSGLKVGNLTLFKVSSGKIVNSFDNIDEIKSELQ